MCLDPLGRGLPRGVIAKFGPHAINFGIHLRQAGRNLVLGHEVGDGMDHASERGGRRAWNFRMRHGVEEESQRALNDGVEFAAGHSNRSNGICHRDSTGTALGHTPPVLRVRLRNKWMAQVVLLCGELREPSHRSFAASR